MSYQSIQVIHLIDLDRYEIRSLGRGNNNVSIRLEDGSLIDVLAAQLPAMIGQKPVSATKEATATELTGYKSYLGTHTGEEYKAIRSKLLENAIESDEYDSDPIYHFNSIEEEVAFLKFERSAERQYRTVVRREDVPIDIVGTKYSCPTPFGVSQYTLDGTPGMVILRPRAIRRDEFMKVIKEFKIESYDIPNHSELQYSKINGAYVGLNEYKQEELRVTLEDCLRTEKLLRDHVRTAILAKIVPTLKLNHVMVSDALNTLKQATEQLANSAGNSQKAVSYRKQCRDNLIKLRGILEDATKEAATTL